MGNIFDCTGTTDKEIITNQSLIQDFQIDETIKLKYGYAYEYKIGPYFQNEQNNESFQQIYQQNRKISEKNEKILNNWNQMAKQSQQIFKQNQETKKNTPNNNKQLLINDILEYQNNNNINNKIDIMMQQIQFTDKNQFINNIQKGPPTALRWHSWKAQLQWDAIFENGLYETLIEDISQNKPQYDQIQKDILRTFPKQVFFSQEMKGKSLGHQQFLRVLYAISNYFPDLGYCQGMNFTVGFLTMVSSGNEIEAFWAFVSLVRNSDFMIIGLYEYNMPLLKFLEFITEQELIKNFPKIQQKFESIQLQHSFWLTKWYMTLFLYTFPIETCIRIWDFILTENIFALISLSLAILDQFQKYLVNSQGPEEIYDFFQNLTKNEEIFLNKNSKSYININTIIEKSKKFKISETQITKYSLQYSELTGDQFNKYVNIYQNYNNTENFLKCVESTIKPQIYNHKSRFEQNLIQQRKDTYFSDQTTDQSEQLHTSLKLNNINCV